MPETRQPSTLARIWRPKPSQLVKDSLSNRVGVYMARETGLHWLRPVGGGVEWSTEQVEQASEQEVAAAKASAPRLRSQDK